MPATPDPVASAPCTQCGAPDAHAVGDEVLCPSCCHERGSCGATGNEEETRDDSPDPKP